MTEHQHAHSTPTEWAALRHGMRMDNRIDGPRQRRKQRSRMNPLLRRLIRDGWIIARHQRDEAARATVDAHRKVWVGLCKMHGVHINKYTGEADLAHFPGAFTPEPRTSLRHLHRSMRPCTKTTKTPSPKRMYKQTNLGSR